MLAVCFAVETQSYSAKSVRSLVHFAPAGHSDMVARVLSQKPSAA